MLKQKHVIAVLNFIDPLLKISIELAFYFLLHAWKSLDCSENK